MELDARRLTRALQAMPSRDAIVLLHGVVDGRALTEVYGVSPAAGDLLLYRAALHLDEALTGSPQPVAPFEGEQRHAEELRRCLEAARLTPPHTVPSPGGPLGVPTLAGALHALAAQGAEVRHLLALDEAAAEASPARARENWLRRVAVVIIVALAAYFWWSKRNRPLPPPMPRPTQVR